MKTDTAPTTPRRRRVAPALALFLLAPLVAEWLLGNQTLLALPALLILAPTYGGAALLIREATLRTGRGWPTIFLLALAYGLLGEGLITQMLFNPDYYGHDLLSGGYVAPLGISVPLTVTVMAMHTVWSISVPIALMEALVPARARTPWLGRTSLTVTSVLFVLGLAAAFAWERSVSEGFVAPAPQLTVTVVVLVAVVGAAFTTGRRVNVPVDRPAPRPWLAGAVAFTASSGFFLLTDNPTLGPWLGTGASLALAAAVTAVVVRWSRRTSWGASHRLALAAGAILTYAWLGFGQQPLIAWGPADKLFSNLVFALGSVVLLRVAARRVRRAGHAGGGEVSQQDAHGVTAGGGMAAPASRHGAKG